MYVRVVSPDYLCILQVQVSVYCAGRIPAHHRSPSIQSCCTLSIYTSYRVFLYGRYCKSRLVCVLVSDLDSFRHHTHL